MPRLRHLRRDSNRWSFLTVFIGLLVAIPVFAIVIHLLDGAGEMWGHITRHFLLDYTTNSLIILGGTGVLCFVVGTASAWIVTQYDFPFRRWVEWILFLPLALPSYIVAYAYVGFLGNGSPLMGWLQSLGLPIQKVDMMNLMGLIWVLGFSLYPYVYAGTRALFNSLPDSVRDTANLLGASRRKYFLSVALPLASPAIIGGLFLVFMEVLNDYGAAKYYGINTFTTGIFRTWTALEDLPSAIYLSALLVALVLLLNALVVWQRGRRSYQIKVGDARAGQRSRKPLRGRKKWLYIGVLALPITFGFLLPVGQLIYWGVLTFDSMFNLHLFDIAWQSFVVAISAAVFILLTALTLHYASRWNHFRWLRLFTKTATLGYVIPGAIIGIGIISSSQGVIGFFNDQFGLRIGWLFYGSSVILVYAYVFRFLAVAYHPIEANVMKLGGYLRKSAYLLGSGKLKTWWRVELPLLRLTLMSALVLVVIDVLKELPLTLILKPYELETLAVKAYEYADDERVAEAAWPALLILVVVGLLMFLLNYRELRGKRSASTPPQNQPA